MSKGFWIAIAALVIGVVGFLSIGTLYEPDIPVEPVSAAVAEPTTSTQPSKTKEMAHKFANEIYADIYENDIYMFDAYNNGEAETLRKLTYNFDKLIISFKSYGDDPDWTLAPYYDCESAYFEHRNLLFALDRDLQDNDADSRKQIRYRQGRFDKAFEKCKSRVEMTPEQAQESYDIEQS